MLLSVAVGTLIPWLVVEPERLPLAFWGYGPEFKTKVACVVMHVHPIAERKLTR
jgi:hypothetical protein